MTGPEEPDNLTSMESATETIKRIFEGSTSPVARKSLMNRRDTRHWSMRSARSRPKRA